MASTRDPYPYPRLENDTNFVKVSPQKEATTQDGGNLRAGENPWNRLYDTPTLTSHRRHVYYYDPQAPHDSLDFVLKCQYNHSEEIMKSKAETLKQPESIDLPHGRILKNRPVIPKPLTLEEQDLVEFSEPRKTTVNSAKGLAIESHHSEATNRGYSRKHDGGFYST